jgi:signal transduction histidine kinase
MDLILLDFQPTDIGAVVGAAVEQQRTHAERNQVGLNLNIAPDVPRVQADRKSLERAMLAILDNAVKFSPDGGDVQVNVYRNDGQVWVEVCDHGVGIPPEVLPHIFDRFFHTDKIGDHLFRGVGLGLSIARQVIEQHGGAIDVQSQPGAGSTFFVKL